MRTQGMWMSALTLLLVDTAVAATRFVPTQYPTIQAAIWASTGSDTVAVLPGTYVQNIVIDRGVVVRSTGGPAVTVISGENPTNPDSASTVTMIAGQIIGFSIRRGGGALDTVLDQRNGGGVLALGNAVVRGNWIHDNVLTALRGAGGGVHAGGSSSVIANRVYNNSITASRYGFGGGLFSSGSLVENNEIFGNHIDAGTAGGMYTRAITRHNIIACNTVVDSPLDIYDASGLLYFGLTAEANTIVGNWGSQDDAGLLVVGISCTPPCTNMIFANNIAFNIGPGAQCIMDFGQSAEFACNNIYGNSGPPLVGDCSTAIGQDGNISVDPEFGTGTCPYQSGHWCLGPDSPLLPENSPPGCGLIGALGECSQIGIADAPPPSSLRGGPAVPNPFTERTTISFYLAQESAVEIAIVDVLGRQIRRLEPGHMGIGDHAAQWDGRTEDGVRAASGAYVAVIRAGGSEVTQTLLLLR